MTRLGAIATALLLCVDVTPAQPVRADIDAIGFEAETGAGRNVVRYGQWFPIMVQLSADGSSPYNVELRCEQEDLDGDHVAYVSPDVVANPATPKRVWCYATVLMKGAGGPLTLDVIGDDGALISSSQAPIPEPIPNDTMLILDISDKRVTSLDGLNTALSRGGGESSSSRTYYRPVCVASLPARDLPDRWWGLEAIDVIVWDEPDPDALRDPTQLPALIEWVRNGGQLVVGIGPSWTKVQKSELAEIMPITGDQPAAATTRLDTVTRRFGGGARQFDSPIAVAVGEPTSDAIVSVKDRLSDNRVVNFISMRCVDSGRVIAVATRLRDLKGLNWTGLNDPFARQLFDLNRTDAKFLQAEAERQWTLSQQSLYPPIISQIEFRRLASARVLAAFAFVAAYILIATFGAWAWLRRHTLTQVSWTVFAGFAVAASALSLGAVGLSRGVTGAEHTYSLVDLEAGSSHACAKTYFGYKSSRRQRVDLSLPGNENFLRPLTSLPGYGGADYATPDRYTAIPTNAELKDTLIRATLKQFEGFRRGMLQDSVGGALTIHAELTADRRTGFLSPRSWIQNDLDVELLGGYLLYIDPRLREAGEVPSRVAGLDKRNDRPDMDNKYYGSDRVPPAVNVLAVPIPKIEPGKRVSDIWAEQYKNYAAAHDKWANAAEPEPKSEPMLTTLRDYQIGDWIGAMSGFSGALASDDAQTDAAALLASTRDLYLNNSQQNNFDSVGAPVTTAGLLDADITHWLMRGQAVLLLISDQPGPAKLTIDGDPDRVKVSDGRTLYRVRVPITYTGRPPTGNNE